MVEGNEIFETINIRFYNCVLVRMYRANIQQSITLCILHKGAHMDHYYLFHMN